MVDRLDLKTGDTLDQAVFATIDANVAELDSTKANSSDVPDVSGFVTQADINSAVSGLAKETDIPEVPDISGLTTRIDGLESRLDALEAASDGGAA